MNTALEELSDPLIREIEETPMELIDQLKGTDFEPAADETVKEVTNLLGQTLALERTLKRAQDTPDLTRVSAEALNIALSANGLRPAFNTAMMGGLHQRRQAVSLAKEDLIDTLQEMVKRLVQAMARMARSIYAQISGLLNGASTISNRAAALNEKAMQAKASHGDKSGPSIKNAKLSTILSDGSSVYSADDIQKHYLHLTGYFNTNLAHKTITSGGSALMVQIGKIVSKKKSGAFTKEEALAVSDQAIDQLLHNSFSYFEDSGADEKHYKGDFGGLEITLSVTKDGDKKAGIGLSKKMGSKAKAELPCLKPSEIVKLTSMVESSMQKGLYSEYKSIRATLDRLRHDIEILCDQITKNNRTAMAGDVPSLQFIKTIYSVVYEMVQLAYAYNGTVANSILKYCEVSLKAAGKTA